MGHVKQILVVDDHFEMLEFLRSMLELADQEYQVLGVPSAEEAYLELRRMPYDLLITDLRLPGMSGFELVRQARRWWPEMPVIMITAYSSYEGRQEAAELGIHGYFEKPPDTDALLASVRSALARSNGVGPAPPPPELEPLAPPMPVSSSSPSPLEVVTVEIDRCLENLQADTGAAQVGLADLTGEVLFVTGAQSDLDMHHLVRIVAAGLENSFILAGELGSAEPFAIQYQAGRRYDLYAANIGRTHIILLVVDAQVRRGRIGTVWVFTQRAIKQLSKLLRDFQQLPPGSELLPTRPLASQDQESPASPEKAGPATNRPETEQVAPPLQAKDPAGTDPLFDLLLDPTTDNESELDAYWADVLATGTLNAGGEGLSYQEAIQQGLIPPDLDNTDRE